MADEDQPPAPDELEQDHIHEDEADADPIRDDEPDEDEAGRQDDALPADDLDDQEGPLTERLTLSTRNLSVLGRLIVSFAARDVTLWLDGDAALRLLATFRNRGRPVLGTDFGDYLHPATSSARDAWVVLDAANEPLAMSWIPGAPHHEPRTAIDPAVPA